MYLRPKNKFVATFLGNPSMNIFKAKLEKNGDNVYAKTDKFRIKLLAEEAKQPNVQAHVDKEVYLGLRPEALQDVEFVTDINVDPENIITIKVDIYEPMGASAYLTWFDGDSKYIAEVDAHTSARVEQEIKLYADPRGIQLFDRDTEETMLVKA